MRKTPQHFRDAIDSLGIPKRDTVGLRVTHRAPAGFNTVNGRFVCNSKKYNAEKYDGKTTVGLYVSGSWISNKGDAHVVKSASVAAWIKYMVHEIGHHVTLTLKDDPRMDKLDYVIENLERMTTLGTFGLREYSLTNWKELLADSYKVRYCGTKEQWAGLVCYFKAYGVDLVEATAA